MALDSTPDCHDYPPSGTRFGSIEDFGQFRKFFCHMRNATFQTYNNSASSIHLCPNYRSCGGVLHGLRSRRPKTDAIGNSTYDRNGYIKYTAVPHLVIGPLTKSCDCFPSDRSTSINKSREILQHMVQTTNVSRAEFTHLANSYFAVAGKENYSYKDTGHHITWSCLMCKSGRLRITMNRNAMMDPSKYQTYGTITIASPCRDDCESHRSSLATKTIWLPKSHERKEMAVTAEEIQQRKLRYETWTHEARNIAQGLLTQHQIQKSRWKLEYMTEDQLRHRIEAKKAKISKSSSNRKRRKITHTRRKPKSTTTNSVLYRDNHNGTSR